MVAPAHPAPTRGTMLPRPATEAIEVLHLRKTYGATVAVDDVSFSVARSANAAGGIGQLLFFPLVFFSGLFVPRALMGPVLRDIGDWTPLGASVHALQDSMQGTFPSAQPLLVLAAWAVVFGFLAARFFRWE